MVTLTVRVNEVLGPVHTELLAIMLALAMQKKMGGISVVSDALLMLWLIAQCERTLTLHLHVPSMSPFFVPFENGLNAITWYCLHVTS